MVTYVYDTVTGNVEITIEDCNDGDVPLTDSRVHLRANGVEYGFSPMDHTSPYFISGDTNANGILDPEECWTWYVVVTISETTFFEAWGYGVDPLGNPVTYDPDTGEGLETEYQSFSIEVGNATRTLGFWKTHLEFTTLVFTDYAGNNIDLGWKNITSIEQMMGIFWADVAKNSGGSKRNNLCKAKLQVSWQAIAAILNSSMPGGETLPAGITPESIANTLEFGTTKEIRALGVQLDTYNNSGDDQALDPGLPSTGRADPNGARDIADIPFADC